MKLKKDVFRLVIYVLLFICGITILLRVGTQRMKNHSYSNASAWILKITEQTKRLKSTGQKIGVSQIANDQWKLCSYSSFTSEIKGNRTADMRPCVMAECPTESSHVEHNITEFCNMMYCNKTKCKPVKCPKTTNSPNTTSITTEDAPSHHNDGQKCTSLSLFSAREMGIVGGHWIPTECRSTRRVAIIIPFRDREEHLCILLKNLIPILMVQQTEFRIFIGNTAFNKGRVMNAGFLEAVKIFEFDCVFFHDVDLIPENDRILYECGEQPRHLSVAIDEHGYKLKYSYLVGGVLGFRPQTFRKVNGYSNMFWGWGGEDDDIYFRMTHLKFRVIRPPASVARYTMVRHKKREIWPKRMQVLNTWKTRMKTDGLSNVPYKLISVQIYTYYTKIRVDVGKEDDIKKKADVTFPKHGPSVHA
ncbi:beta-1,4-galactosyltransferase 4-like isoform X2 [Saccostrea echinata]|uniref:beta-1,4-galactosyltransferase 4-like isoform X2 n=1 Tax=Saccostrea echinata TaxID=191078 RepID=UPI002A841411|nr:beta-1,4-galactosyltransferase 4-like isoform X2 [Saccostrea echinata]